MCKDNYDASIRPILPSWSNHYRFLADYVGIWPSPCPGNPLDSLARSGIVVLTLREEPFMPHHTHDAKSSALRQRGCLHPRPNLVTDELFADNVFFDPRDLLQVKYEMLRRVLVDGCPVSRSAASFGLSRPSFYQARAAFEAGGLAALVPKKRGPRHAHKLSEAVMEGRPPDAGAAAADEGGHLGRTGAAAIRHLSASAQCRACLGAAGKKTSSMNTSAMNAEPTTTPQEQPTAPEARYEQLRTHMVTRQFTTGRLGMGVVIQAGLAAWIEQWSKLPASTPLRSQAPSPTASLPEVACPHVVHVLSAMALGHLREATA